MGKALFQSSRTNATTATLREWVGAWLQGMLDAGFVQTDDTGQVNPATIEVMTTNDNASDVYEYAVFRFDDDLQSTHPIYFKVEFCKTNSTTTGSTVSNSTLAVTVGKGTDGAGTIVNPVVNRFFPNQVWQSTNCVSASSFTHLAASGPGWAGFMGFTAAHGSDFGSAVRCWFIIERARTNSGGLRGDALMVAFPQSGATNTPTFSTIGLYEVCVMAVAYESGLANSGIPPVIAPYSISGSEIGAGGALAAGSIGPIYPWDLIAPGRAPWRSCVIVSIPGSDMPGDVFETNLCGEPANFYPIPPSLPGHSRWGLAVLPPTTTAQSYSRRFGAGLRWED